MADTNERTPLLKVEHLSKEFPAESGMFAKRFSKRCLLYTSPSPRDS